MKGPDAFVNSLRTSDFPAKIHPGSCQAKPSNPAYLKLLIMKKGIILFIFCGLALVYACKRDVAVNMCETITGATFSSDGGRIRGILQTKCGVSGCHVPGAEGSAQWVFDMDYDHLQPHFDQMYDAVNAGTMPPAVSTALTQEEKNLFKCWHDRGFPE